MCHRKLSNRHTVHRYFTSSHTIHAVNSTPGSTGHNQKKFRKIGATLPLDPTRFYQLINGKHDIFPIGDEIASIQENLTRGDCIAAIYHLTDLIRSQKMNSTT